MSSDGAISAMTKLSESLVRNQEAALKASEEKVDNRLKAWEKLPKIQQDIILLGGRRMRDSTERADGRNVINPWLCKRSTTRAIFKTINEETQHRPGTWDLHSPE